MAAVTAVRVLPVDSTTFAIGSDSLKPQEPDVAIEESEKCHAVQAALFGLSSSDEEEDTDQGGQQQHASLSQRSDLGAASKRGVLDPSGLVALQADSSLLDVKSTQKVAELSPEPSFLAMASAQSQCLAQVSRPPPIRTQPQHAAAAAKAPVPVPTPTSQAAPTGVPPTMPRCRTVLVAKCLTNSDASSGRVILPRVAVETNLPFVTPYRHYALPVTDSLGQQHTFCIKSWANGTEHRRVFVLEQATDFLRSHGVGVGDAVGICTDDNGDLVVEVNTPEVRQATVCPKYGALAVHVPPPAAGAAVPLTAGTAAGRCARSVHCTKPAGHPGFCSGPKAAAGGGGGARRAAAGRGREARLPAAGGRSPRCALLLPGCASGTEQPAAAAASEEEGGSSDGEASTQLLACGSSPAASAAAVGAAFGRAGCEPVVAATAAEAGSQAGAELPPGMHTLADLPVGVRLAKMLTSYDLSSKTVVMPAGEVEEEVGNALEEDLLTLAAVDESEGWQFMTLRAWVNLAHRRGYLLEGAHAFLANRGAAPGDTLLVYRETHRSPPRIEVHAASGPSPLRLPARPDTRLPFAALPFLLDTEEEAELSAASMSGKGGGKGRGALRCRRTNGCTKQAGHQGFCYGHKGHKRTAPTQLLPHRQRSGYRVAHRARRHYEEDSWSSEEEEEEAFEEFTPPASPAHNKRQRRAGAADGSSDPLLSLLSLLGDGGEEDGHGFTSTGAAPARAQQAAAAEEARQVAEAAAAGAVHSVAQRAGC